MDILLKAKEKLLLLEQKISRLVCALGGRIEGESPLSAEESTRIRRRVAFCLLSSVSAFLLAGGEAPFGSYPFALALLCASGYSGTLFVLLGALAGALTLGNAAFAHLLVYITAAGARALLSPRTDVQGRRLFEESRHLKILICLSCSFLMGLYTFVSSIDSEGISGVFSLLFSVLFTPALCWLFSHALDISRRDASAEAGIYALLFAVIYSLSVHSFFGHSFALSASFFVILASAQHQGALRGSFCGLICALATGQNPLAYSLSGFASGAFRVFGAVPSALVALAVCLGTTVYTQGLTSIITAGADMVFACLIYLPLAKTDVIKKLFPLDSESAQDSGQSKELSEQKARESEKKRFLALSKAFDELSTVLVRLSDNLRSPGMTQLTELCEDTLNKYCKKCSLTPFCRQKYFEDTEESIRELAECARNKGYIEKTDAPEFLAKRCRHIDKIIWDINRGCADMVEEAVKRDKTELFALDYEAISRLLRESSEKDGEYSLDSTLQSKTSKALRSLGISFMACGAWGNRRKTLLASGVDVGSIAVSSMDICNCLEKATGLSLTQPEFSFSGEFVSMTLTSRVIYEAKFQRATCCAKGEEISGDKCSFFQGAGDYAYGYICDGMGSGRHASSVSEISALFFEKMLGAGNSISVTLKMLCNFLRARSDEYHCTADLFRLDKLSGKGCFIKCGAPASYILRGANLFRIDARSMPLGLTREINAEKIEMQLEDGDRVIMMSDGVAPDLEDALWLPELILSCRSLDDRELAESITRRAKAENSDFDDISVGIIRIEKSTDWENRGKKV